MDLAGRRVGQRRYTDIDNVGFVLRSVYKYDRALLGLAALNAVFSSITHFVPILMPKLVNDQLTTGGAPGTVLAIVAVFSAALCVSASIAQTAGNWLSHRFIVVRLRLIAESGYKFMTMDFQNLEDRKVLDMAQRGDRACNNNADGVEGVMHRLLSSSSRVIVLTGATAVITLLHPLLLLAIAALIAINYSVSTRARRLDKAINVGLAKVWRRVNHISGVMSNFDYGKDIRLFGMKDFLLARYGDEQQRLNDGNRRLERVWLHQRQGDEWGWSAWSLEHSPRGLRPGRKCWSAFRSNWRSTASGWRATGNGGTRRRKVRWR